jgi:hypothetical protein
LVVDRMTLGIRSQVSELERETGGGMAGKNPLPLSAAAFIQQHYARRLKLVDDQLVAAGSFAHRDRGTIVHVRP